MRQFHKDMRRSPLTRCYGFTELWVPILTMHPRIFVHGDWAKIHQTNPGVQPSKLTATNWKYDFPLVYGKIFHAYVVEIHRKIHNENHVVNKDDWQRTSVLVSQNAPPAVDIWFEPTPKQRAEIILGWDLYWTKWFIRRASPDLPAYILDKLIDKGIKRGRGDPKKETLGDVENYLNMCQGHLAPALAHLEYDTGKYVHFRGCSFNVRAMFDQLRFTADRADDGLPQTIVELKTNNCSFEQFKKTWAPRYLIQLKIYAIVYMMLFNRRVGSVELWHIPSGQKMIWRFTDQQLVKRLNHLKKVESFLHKSRKIAHFHENPPKPKPVVSVFKKLNF